MQTIKFSRLHPSRRKGRVSKFLGFEFSWTFDRKWMPRVNPRTSPQRMKTCFRKIKIWVNRFSKGLRDCERSLFLPKHSKNMLNIIEVDSEPKIIQRMKKSLMKKFRPNSENDIDQAIQLSNYLYAIGEVQQSKDLLYSFLYFKYEDKDENHQHLWASNAQGLVLLAYIELESNNNSQKLKLIGPVVKEPYKGDVGEGYFKELLYDYRHFEWHSVHYRDESHKYRCEILCQEILTFLYWRETWEPIMMVFDAQKFPDELEKIEKIINVAFSLLKEELTN